MAGTDFSHLTTDELIKGIKALDLPDYIRSKAYGIDVRETLAQMTEMTIQLGVNMGLSPEDALEWARKLQESVSQSEFDSWVATLLDGGPSIFMNTLNELKATYPNGAAGVALVRETDPAKIYVWNGSAWEDFGDYQGIEVKDGTITPLKTTFIDTSGYATNYEKGNVTGANVVKGYRLAESSRSVFYKVKPNTSYTVTKDKSDRFRILSTSDYPSPTSNFVRFIKDEATTADETNDTAFSFRTTGSENYIIVTVSVNGKEPRVRLIEGYSKSNLDDVAFNGKLSGENIVKGKNLFDGVYHEGTVVGVVSSPNDAYFKLVGRDHSRSIIQPIERNTNYSIYKTVTNRFRVALTNQFPSEMSSLYIIQDETGGSDKKNSLSFNSGEYDYLVVTVSNEEDNIEIPDFVQIEKSDKVTELETYGYKFSPEAKSLVNAENDDVVRVESFRLPDMTDSEVLQKAFDNANGQIISLQSGRTYSLDSTVSALASKVRGIIGNNATLEINGTNQVALKITGSKTTGSAAPPTVSDDLIKSEGNFTIDGLVVTSNSKFKNDGIEAQGLLKPIIKDTLIFRCKNGLIFKGMSRDVTLDNNNIYDNAETGLLFDNVNIHQLLIRGGHNSYNKNCVKFIDGNIANVVFDSASIENNISGGGYDVPESIVSFEETSEGNAIFEVIIFSGCNIQEHGKNTKPLVNFDVSNGQIYDVIIGDTLLGNSGPSSVPFYGKNINRLSINNVNTPSNVGPNSFVLEGDIIQARITNSNIVKPIKYETATISKMIIANNTTVGFTLEDSKTENILIQGNL